MRFRIFLFSLIFSCSFGAKAQLTPVQIKYNSWDIHALRYYPFTQRADSIVLKTISKIPAADPVRSERTSVDFIIENNFLGTQIALSANSNNWLRKYVVKPYLPWIRYIHPFRENYQNLNLALFDSQSDSTGEKSIYSKSLFNRLGTDKIEYIIRESLGEVDLQKSKNDVLFHSIKSPLHSKYFHEYQFYLSKSEEFIDSVPCYEVVFFSKEKKAKAYEGYLYISKKDHSLQKAIFTLNASLDKKRGNEILFVQTPAQIESRTYLGDEFQGNILISRNQFLQKNEADFPELNPAQKDLDLLLEEADRTRAYRNTQNGIYFFLTHHLPGKYFNFGPVFQTISYNSMEGLRLRLGGNTSERLSRKLQLGGYLAYGFRDEDWKFRGDVLYAPTPKDRLSFSYVRDLNIPGYDLLTSTRDNVFHSFTHSKTNNMSLQHIAVLSYEKDFSNYVSAHIGGKFLSDRPQGTIQYFRTNNETEIIPELRASEVQLGIRYAPKEKFIRIENKKINFRNPETVIEVNHRIGIKDLLGGDYDYHITDFSAYRRWELPADIGSLSFQVSGGKVWNKIPFPLLFVPAGNQSYIIQSTGYNLMQFHEFVTDQYIAGNLDMKFNWSVFDLFMNSSIKTGLGIRTIYGPLSDKNNPSLQPDLFVLNGGVSALNNDPYTEVNIGLINIMKILRVDYVYRLNYDRKGSIFFTSSFLF
ncbi:DUF5686 family protein [Bacteroidales bacterium OttesenSCG-928-A17]|nr:DUF5686 family protein [Bacteroidales bacterium OttesenSCG-928-A17]